MVCVVHVIYIGYYNIFPDTPNVRVFKVNLNEIIFPIAFKICVADTIVNATRFQNLGYWGEWHYFRGQRIYDRKKIGWNGHTENGSTLGSVKEIWSSASLDWKNILLALQVDTKEGEVFRKTKDFKLSRADYRGCKLLNLNHHFDLSQIVPASIKFEFAQQENRVVSLKLQFCFVLQTRRLCLLLVSPKSIG